MMKLTKMQKILLAALAVMLVVSGGLMAVFRTHPGVRFGEGLLRVSEDGEQTVYSGKVQGKPVTITVSHPSNILTQVDFAIGEEIHDVCQVEYPLDVLRTDRGFLVRGVRIAKNGEVLFEGGYDPESEFGWYDAEGQWLLQLDDQFSTGGYSWYGYETGAGQIVRFAFGAEAGAARGDPRLFAAAVLLSILAAVQILFHKELFRWRHWGARDPEPTEGYLALDRIGWVVLTVIAACFYLAALTAVY